METGNTLNSIQKYHKLILIMKIMKKAYNNKQNI